MPLNIDFQQILLHLLNFTILFAALYFILYNPVKKFMQDREDYYKKLDDDANSKLEDAERAKEEYLNKVSMADKEIEEKEAKMLEKVEEAKELKIRKAREEASRILTDAKSLAEIERQKVISEAQAEITKLATDMAEKILEENTSAAFDDFLNIAEVNSNNE